MSKYDETKKEIAGVEQKPPVTLAEKYDKYWDDLQKELEKNKDKESYAERMAQIRMLQQQAAQAGTVAKLNSRQTIDDINAKFSDALSDGRGGVAWPMAVNGAYWIARITAGISSFAATFKTEYERLSRLQEIKDIIKEKTETAFQPKDFNKEFSSAISSSSSPSGVDFEKLSVNFQKSISIKPTELNRSAVNGSIDIKKPEVVFSFLAAPQAKGDFSVYGDVGRDISIVERNAAEMFRNEYQYPAIRAMLAAGVSPEMKHEGRDMLTTLMSQKRMGSGNHDPQFTGMMFSLLEHGVPVNGQSGNDSPLTLARTPYEMNILFAAGATDQTFFNGDTVAMRMIRHAEVEIINSKDPAFKAARMEMLGACMQSLHKQGFDLDVVNLDGISAKTMFSNLTGTQLTLGDKDPIQRSIYKTEPSNLNNRVVPEEVLGAGMDPVTKFWVCSDLRAGSIGQQAVKQADLLSFSLAQASRQRSLSTGEISGALKFFMEWPANREMTPEEVLFAKTNMDRLARIGEIGRDINQANMADGYDADAALKAGLQQITQAAMGGDLSDVLKIGNTFKEDIKKISDDVGVGGESGEFWLQRASAIASDYYQIHRFGYEDFMSKIEDIKGNPGMAHWHPDTPVRGDQDGNNLMMIALKNDSVDTVKFLLSLPKEYQCNLNARNLKGESISQLLMESYARTGDEKILALIVGNRDNKTAPADQPLAHRLGDNRVNMSILTSVGLSLPDHYRMVAIENLQKNRSLTVQEREAAYKDIDRRYQELIDVYGMPVGQQRDVSELRKETGNAVIAEKPAELPTTVNDFILFGNQNVDDGIRKKVVGFLTDSYYENYVKSENPDEAMKAMNDILVRVKDISLGRLVNEVKDMVYEGTDKNPMPVDVKSAFAMYQILEEKRKEMSPMDPRDEAKLFGMDPDNPEAGSKYFGNISKYFSAMEAIGPATAVDAARKGMTSEEKAMMLSMHLHAQEVRGGIVERLGNDQKARLAAANVISNASGNGPSSYGSGP